MTENIPNQYIIWKPETFSITIYTVCMCFLELKKSYSKNGEISPSFLYKSGGTTELSAYDIELHKKQVLRQVCWICLMPWYLFCVQFTRTRCLKSDYIHLCTFYTHISYNTCAYTNSVTSTGLYRKYLIKIAFFM